MHTIFRLFAVLTFAFCFESLAAAQPSGTDTVLSYFDQNTSLNVFFPLPGTYGVSSGTDTARTIVAYSERFSCPWPVTKVNTVSIALRIDRLDAGAAIPVLIQSATPMGGHLFADFSKPAIAEDSITPGNVESGKISYDIAFDRVVPDSTFFVTIVAKDTAETHAALRADSKIFQVQQAIGDSDRAQFYLDKPYHDVQASYLAGTTWPFITDGFDYSNFVILAEVSTPTGGVAELYPADRDPLKYFVERSASGELILHYSLAHAGTTTLTLYDARGAVVRTLSTAQESSGTHQFRIDDLEVSKGMYFARLSANGVSEVRPLALAH